MPQRLHRTRRRANFTPTGAVYVGRPTIFGNPFDGRPRIGHKRSVILHAAWLAGQVDARVLGCAGIRNATPIPFRDLLLSMARSVDRRRLAA